MSDLMDEGAWKLVSTLIEHHHNPDVVQDAVLAVRQCESPIEVRLGLALALFSPSSAELAEEPTEKRLASRFRCRAILHRRWAFSAGPQIWIDDYRVDFLAVGANPKGGLLSVAIECDGHDFHERTKEQAARDRSRDRDLISQDYTVMRFTGSEIWKDAPSCAEQIWSLFGNSREFVEREIKEREARSHDASR